MARGKHRRQTRTTRSWKGGNRGVGVLALEATGLLTQDVDPCGTSLVDAHNSFNEMIRLKML